MGQPGLGQDRAHARGRRAGSTTAPASRSPRSGPPRREHHADEATWGASLAPERTRAVDEVRLSTTTDEAGRQIRAGIELWIDSDDEYPYRGTGEVLTGSTLELGALRLDVAFFRWHIEGRTGRRPLRRDPARVIKAVVSDFGGVVTLPLTEAFKRAHEEIGIPLDALRKAMALNAARYGEPTLFKLERGQMTEAEFIAGLEADARRGARAPDHARRLRRAPDGRAASPTSRCSTTTARLRDERGIRLAILTNNVREWHDAWRTRLKVDELFELVVDSAFEGCRKPEPEIYALTLERLGLPAGDVRVRRRRRGQRHRRQRSGHARDPLPRHRRRRSRSWTQLVV